METHRKEKSCLFHNWFKDKFQKISTDLVDIGQATSQVAREDPRRIVHSIKVGVAIAMVSLFYYFDPLYDGFGVNAMWAVLTVVVVFEYSVGATLGKGVNRVMATILGGMAGVGAHRLASFPRETMEPVLLGLSVFIIAAVTTFMRFFPKMKARFDYGLAIFILTFSLICVSAYRDDEVLDMAQRRVTTILIGSSTAVIVCVLIWPVWAGTDLHTLVASDIQKLGDFLLEFGVIYFKMTSNATPKQNDKLSLDGFKRVRDSKSSVDSLVNFARWEPRHGRFKHWHPWTQYQLVGELTRHCACRAEALHGYLLSPIQPPDEVKAKFQESCIKMSTESGKALIELSTAISRMTQTTKPKLHIQNAKQAAQDLNVLLTSMSTWKTDLNFSDVTPVATVASLLAHVVACTEEVEVAVQELASLANFDNIADEVNVVVPDSSESSCNDDQLTCKGSIKQRSFTNHVVTFEGCSSPSSPSLSISEVPSSLAMAQHVTE